MNCDRFKNLPNRLRFVSIMMLSCLIRLQDNNGVRVVFITSDGTGFKQLVEDSSRFSRAEVMYMHGIPEENAFKVLAAAGCGKRRRSRNL